MSSDNRRPTSLVGVTLNGIYEVKRFIARGGMGEVYEGSNVNSDERVAIKVILPELASDPKVQAMFLKEARTLTKLSHPALVQYRVLAQEPELGCLYIAMDYIDGTSLSDVLASYGPTLPELTALTRRLADGLRAAHDLGAIHRDLSPDNVLLERGRLERARIIDFGIAKDTTGGTATIIGDGFAGKLGYVAPEQLGDFDREVGPWSDVYSLGLIILSFIKGAPINMGTTLVDAIEMRRKPIDLSDAPAEMRPLLQAMLVGDPKARLRSMNDVIDVIDRSNYQRTMFAPPVTIIEDGPSAAPPPPPPPAAMAPVAAAPAAATPVAAPATPASTPQAPSASTFGGGGKKLGLIGGGVAALALIAGGGYYFLHDKIGGGGATSGIDSVANEIPCSWLSGKTDEDSGGLNLYGAALDPASLPGKLASAAKGAEISTQYVAPLTDGACALIDAIKPTRSSEPLLVPEQVEYELRVGGAPKAPDLAGKPSIVVRTQIKIDKTKKFAMYQIKGNGEVAPQRIDSSNLDQFVGTKMLVPQSDGSYKFNMDSGDNVEWFGVILMTSTIPTTSAEALPDLMSLSASEAKAAISAAGNQGLKTDMAWFHTVDQQKE
jgi:eukaryotic-like serine/threonine-protein kinase